ncbi:hypothetical protein BDV59DRAFT_10199 [Aspergillus ambiguus]|uniref:uncharacterized protein n=1 Tax=Aspergillus ambiguus TaxID=176160 RepID=UPI003CCD1261
MAGDVHLMLYNSLPKAVILVPPANSPSSSSSPSSLLPIFFTSPFTNQSSRSEQPIRLTPYTLPHLSLSTVSSFCSPQLGRSSNSPHRDPSVNASNDPAIDLSPQIHRQRRVQTLRCPTREARALLSESYLPIGLEDRSWGRSDLANPLHAPCLNSQPVSILRPLAARCGSLQSFLCPQSCLTPQQPSVQGPGKHDRGVKKS